MRLGDNRPILVHEAVPGQGRHQTPHRVPPCRVQLECSAQERSVLRVYLKGSFGPGANEDVPTWRTVRPAALEHLLAHALLDFFGEIRGIEFSERCHDVTEQWLRTPEGQESARAYDQALRQREREIWRIDCKEAGRILPDRTT